MASWFQVQLSTVVTCMSCTSSSAAGDTTNVLQVPITSASLLQCLCDARRPQPLPDRHCPACGTTGSSMIEHQSEVQSKWLCVHLLRFQNTRRVLEKNTSHVKCDLKIKLNDKMYEVIGTVEHRGSLSRGHYIAKVRRAGGWYACNDSTIVPIHPDDVISRDTYLLLFQSTH